MFTQLLFYDVMPRHAAVTLMFMPRHCRDATPDTFEEDYDVTLTLPNVDVMMRESLRAADTRALRG